MKPKAHVLYLFHAQTPLDQKARQGLYKSLARLRLEQVFFSKRLDPQALNLHQTLLLSFFSEQHIPCDFSDALPPTQASLSPGLWVLPLAQVQSYLTGYSPVFSAKACDLIVINTTKKSYRSLSF